MYIFLFSQEVLYWKASRSKLIPLMGSKCMKKGLWNSASCLHLWRKAWGRTDQDHVWL